MEEINIIISARLKAIRKENKMTQREFADKFKISQSSYCGYENGSTVPTLFFLIQVAQEFHLSMDYLTGLSESKKGLQADEDYQYYTNTFLKPIYEQGYDEKTTNKIAILALEQAIIELKQNINKDTPDNQ